MKLISTRYTSSAGKFFLLAFIALIGTISAFSQNGVSINTTAAAPDNSAMLDVASPNKGILIPRMNAVARGNIGTPAPGLLVYQTDAPIGFYYYNGAAWVQLANLPLGQNSVTVVGTAGLTVTSATPFTLLPGMTANITVPSNSVVHITGDGGLQTTSTLAAGFSIVDVVILVDGARPAGAVAYRRVSALNNNGLGSNIANWSMSFSIPLAAGSHTITMVAAGDGIGSNATVGGNNTSVLEPEMTVTVIAQ